MPNDFPHSPEYLARQAERQKVLDKLRDRQTWRDARFLAERDAVYVAGQRQVIPFQIADYESQMKDDNDSEGYIRKYHTEEG